MKKIIILINIFFSSIIFCYASKNNSVVITYQHSYNDKVDSSYNTKVEISKNIAKIYNSGEKLYENAPDVFTYINYNNNTVYTTAILKSGDTIHTSKNFEYEKEWQREDGTYNIQNTLCKKARITIHSNNIEIYYTLDSIFKGTPNPNYGLANGLVLKTVYNGVYTVEAVNIEYSPKEIDLLPKTFGKELKSSEFQKALNDNAVINIDIFKNEKVNFESLENHKNPDIESGEILRFGSGTIILKKVKLPKDSWNYNIFAELTQYSNGDAYDRTGSVFVIPQNKEISYLEGLLRGIETLPYFTDKTGKKHYGMIATENYEPPIELIRFFTGFGTKAYNRIEYGNYNWLDSVVYKQEVSHLNSILCNEAIIGVYISNFDYNGHSVNLTLKYHPNFAEEEPLYKNKVIPLFSTINIMENAGQQYADFFETDTLNVNFNLNKEYKNATLYYTTTGHGGWSGGDEFNKKPNTLILDNRSFTFVPWRTDCATYREKNPCSGNFYNGLSSSDLSRSNWCPGTITVPTEIIYNNITKGKHNLKLIIPQGAKEGNSFNYWNTSGYFILTD
ncbi:MAG: PNGase F N-terminal domain-containing protein [Bacteroidales bacterium]